MIITTIKTRNRQYTITEDDQFLDNGCTTRLISQKGPLRGWDYERVVLTKAMVKHINTFPQKEWETRWSGCRLFSIQAKDTT